MTKLSPNLIDAASQLLDAAAEKETGQAIAARNDLARAQVYALADIAASLRLIAANTTPTTVTAPDAPAADDPAADAPDDPTGDPTDTTGDAGTTTPGTEPPTDVPDSTTELPG